MTTDDGLEQEPIDHGADDPLVQGAPVSVSVSVDEPATAAEALPSRSRDPRPRAVLVLGLVVLLIAAIGVVYFVIHGNGPDPAADLESAVTHSTEAQTAEVGLSVSVSAAGTHESIAGNGVTNFHTNASNMTLTDNAAGRSIAERVIVDGTTAYVNLGPLVSEIAPGKSWVSTNVDSGQPGSTGVAGGSIFSDPNTMIDVLRAAGTAVTTLGPSTVEGVPVRGYAIHLSNAGIEAAMKSVQLPPSAKAELAQAHFDRLDYTVFIDRSDYLKEVRLVGGFGAEGVTATISGTMHYDNYGIPVHVAAPPADEVITMQEFQRLAAQSRGSSNT